MISHLTKPGSHKSKVKNENELMVVGLVVGLYEGSTCNHLKVIGHMQVVWVLCWEVHSYDCKPSLILL